MNVGPGDFWIVNGRCEDCLAAELDNEVSCADHGCSCWCHDEQPGGDLDDEDDW